MPKKGKKRAQEDAFDMVNRYGTYEVQSTCDTDNEYPKIAQGETKKRSE